MPQDIRYRPSATSARPPEGFAMSELEIFLALLDLPDQASRARYLDGVLRWRPGTACPNRVLAPVA